MKAIVGWARWQTPMLLALALIAGVSAVVGIRSYVASRIAAERGPESRPAVNREIVVAKSNLAAGDVLREQLIAKRAVPAEFVTSSSVPAGEHLQLVGRVLAQPVAAGEPVVMTALEPLESPALSEGLPKGTRAMSIQVDEVNSISGMLQAGDHIDLHVALRYPAFNPIAQGSAGDIAAPLLERVLVLATGRSQRNAPRNLPQEHSPRPIGLITVAVTIEQAQKLIVAQRNGRLTALLRARNDDHPVSVKPMELSEALNVRSAVAATPARTGPELIVGGQGPLVSMNAAPQGNLTTQPNSFTSGHHHGRAR